LLHGLELRAVGLADADALRDGVVVIDVLDAFLILLHEGSPALLDLLLQLLDLAPRLRGTVEELGDLVDGLYLIVKLLELGGFADSLEVLQELGSPDSLFFLGMQGIDLAQSLDEIQTLIFLDGLLLHGWGGTLKLGQ
jgi:hypothetical protein